MRHFDGNIKGKTFGMWGLSFKPKTDDMREAPSRILIAALLSRGARVQVYDPVAMEEARHALALDLKQLLPVSTLDGIEPGLEANVNWRTDVRPSS